jgi:cytochrome c5
MKTPTNHTSVLVCTVMLAVVAVCAVRAADESLDEATKARIAKFEQGPATIDVSKYPQDIQEDYELFSQKCTQCHKLSRPINSDYALPAEWERYVKRMMHKPGSGINPTQAKKIFDFLVYDSSVRKKALVDEKLAKATPAERKAAEEKIKEIHDKYDK